MTDAGASTGETRSWADTVFRSPIVLGLAFLVAHAWVVLLALTGPNQPLGDVTLVYRTWVQRGLENGSWVGIDDPAVYPILALLPMIAAWAFGPGPYVYTWLALVILINAAAFVVAIVLGYRRRVVAPAWWWLGFLVALGPIALGRIDSVTVPLVMVGLLLLSRAPRVATVLITLAAWMKVWPAAIVAVAVVAVRSRLVIALTAALTSIAIVVVGLFLGAGGNLVSFLSQQSSRGLQIESVIATPWIWDAASRRPGASQIYYDQGILTFQLIGPGVDVAAALATPLVALAAAGLLVLGILAIRAGRTATELLAPLALGMTVALIVFNKVGSPQFVTWIAAPIVLGIMTAGLHRADSFRIPATLGIAIALLTLPVYPYLYNELLSTQPLAVVLLTVRNALYIVLLVWAVVALVLLARRPTASPPGRPG